MGRQITPFGEEYGRLISDFRHCWFRLEVLQRYTVAYEEEPLRRFLAGEPPPEDPDKEEWLGLIREAAAAGKVMRRVHVVVEPPSDYLRYEFAWEYADNMAAGEDIRIIGVQPGHWPEELPHHDYWLFDSRILCLLDYDEEGRLLGAELVDDPAEIVRHNWWRDVALHEAVPLDRYLLGREELPGELVS
jgi:hypothetical protein